MTLDLKAMKEAAEKAQGNPLYAALVGRSSNISWSELCAQHGLRTDLAHIAASCPANVLALIARCERAEALLGEAREALKAANTLCTDALPKFNWGASALDANAITLLNETPRAIGAVLAKINAAKGGEGRHLP